MLETAWFTLAQEEDFPLAVFLLPGIVVLSAVLIYFGSRASRKREEERRAVQMEAARIRAEAESAAQAEQNEVNRLIADKVRTEVDLLKLQVQSVRREVESPAAREQQELTAQRTRREVELLDLQIRLARYELENREHQGILIDKARLEIESLRLQVIEQRKRLDDFGQYGEH